MVLESGDKCSQSFFFRLGKSDFSFQEHGSGREHPEVPVIFMPKTSKTQDAATGDDRRVTHKIAWGPQSFCMERCCFSGDFYGDLVEIHGI